MGLSHFQPLSHNNATISPGGDVVVDSFGLVSSVSVDYLIRGSHTDDSILKTLKMLVQKDDSGVIDQVYSRLGGPLNFTVGAFLSGSNLEIRVKNNESFAIKVSLIRMKLSTPN